MSTASLTFLLFAGVTLLVYWLLPGRVRWVALLAASLLFYAWGDGWYLPFLGFGILSTYAAARWMQAHADRDAAALAAAGAELSREERKAAMQEVDKKIVSLLTDEQKTAYEKMKQERSQRKR